MDVTYIKIIAIKGLMCDFTRDVQFVAQKSKQLFRADLGDRSYSSSLRAARAGGMNTGTQVWRCGVCKAYQVLSSGVWVTEGNPAKEAKLSPVANTSTILHATPPAPWFRSIIFRKEQLVCVCTY